MDAKSRGILVAIVWGIVGGILAVFSALTSALVGIGGQSSPPFFWGIAILFGMFGLPIPLMLGGVPIGMKIARDEPAGRTAAIVGGIVLTLVVLTHAIIWIWRPKF